MISSHKRPFFRLKQENKETLLSVMACMGCVFDLTEAGKKMPREVRIL